MRALELGGSGRCSTVDDAGGRFGAGFASAGLKRADTGGAGGDLEPFRLAGVILTIVGGNAPAGGKFANARMGRLALRLEKQ